MLSQKILIMGLPGAGKTTLAKALVPLLRAVHFNADDVRREINTTLGFSVADRIEQARRMGWLCDQVVKSGHYAVADFVCPTPETREAFGDAYTVFVNTNKPTPYHDTRTLFVVPTKIDHEVCEQDAEKQAQIIYQKMMGGKCAFDWQKPTAFFLGRYQPFHEGHKALILEGLERVGQVCIGVRDTEGLDEKNPFGYSYIRARIEMMMQDYMDKITILSMPNITNIFYGRDVGYAVERINLPEALQVISATKVRQQMQSEGIELPARHKGKKQ